MRAVVMCRFGGPDVPRLEEVPTPTPVAGEVVARAAAGAVAAAGDDLDPALAGRYSGVMNHHSRTERSEMPLCHGSATAGSTSPDAPT
jgi:hypothetical protein